MLNGLKIFMMEFNQSFDLDLKNQIDETAARFILWRDSLYKEYRGEQMMFDVPGHYMWLNEQQLLTYYLDFKQFNFDELKK